LDTLAGSEREKIDVERIKGAFEEMGLETRRHDIDVALWEHGECYVDDIKCVPIPPTPGGFVEGVLTSDIGSCSDRVLIAPTTSFPDNIWNIYNEAVERGARAVIFYDHYPSRYRKIVVSGVWSYGLRVRSPAPIPSVHIRLEDAVPLIRRGIGKKVSISVATRIRMSRGSNVEAIIPGRSEGSILVSAHHDRWFDSYRDNTVGVETLLQIALHSRKLRTPRHEIRLVSFTAEEIGDPGMPAWYWGYGSRSYAASIDANNILIGLVIDTAHKTPLRISYTSPDHAYKVFGRLALDIELEGYGHPYTDAPSLWMRGIPTITIHNLQDLYPIYHTDLDVREGYRGFPSILGKEILGILLDLDPKGVGAEYLLKDLKARMPYELFRRIEERASNKPYELARCVNMVTLRPLFIGSYRELYKDMLTDPFPRWYALASASKGSKEQVVIPGDERIIYGGGGAEEKGKILSEANAEVDEMLRCIST
jgi:Iap family predicted aminopeptidase